MTSLGWCIRAFGELLDLALTAMWHEVVLFDTDGRTFRFEWFLIEFVVEQIV